MKPDRLLNLFCELVRIESPSRHESAMAARCRAELEALGFAVRFDDSAAQTGSDTGNLIARRAGDVPGALVLCGHMDTVQPCAGIEPVVEDGVIRSAGDTILSADDKAGVAGTFEAVRSLVETGEQLPEICVVLTTCEELHLLGSGALDVSALPAGAPCYVLDADGDPGTIIQSAPCHCTFTATFHGQAAHAGVEPERGNSALRMAAQAVCHMPLGRVSAHTTANVGVIECDGATNVVPATCWLSGNAAPRRLSAPAPSVRPWTTPCARRPLKLTAAWTSSGAPITCLFPMTSTIRLCRVWLPLRALRASRRACTPRAAGRTRTFLPGAACAPSRWPRAWRTTIRATSTSRWKTSKARRAWWSSSSWARANNTARLCLHPGYRTSRCGVLPVNPRFPKPHPRRRKICNNFSEFVCKTWLTRRKNLA